MMLCIADLYYDTETYSMCHRPTPRSSNPTNLVHITTSPPQPLSSDRQLRIASFNAQSLGPKEKRTAVCDFVIDRQIDILFIQETWFRRTGDEAKCADLALSGYSVRSFPHSTRGGGLAVVYRDSLSRHLGFTTDFAFNIHHLKQFNLPYQCPNETFILWAFIVRSPARKTD